MFIKFAFICIHLRKVFLVLIQHEVCNFICPAGELGYGKDILADCAVHIRDHHHSHLTLRETVGIFQDITVNGHCFIAVFCTDSPSDQCSCHGILQIDLFWRIDFLPVDDSIEVWHLVEACDKCSQLDSRSFTHAGLKCTGE